MLDAFVLKVCLILVPNVNQWQRKNVLLFQIRFGITINVYVDLVFQNLDSSVYALVFRLDLFVIDAHINQILSLTHKQATVNAKKDTSKLKGHAYYLVHDLYAAQMTQKVAECQHTSTGQTYYALHVQKAAWVVKTSINVSLASLNLSLIVLMIDVLKFVEMVKDSLINAMMGITLMVMVVVETVECNSDIFAKVVHRKIEINVF